MNTPYAITTIAFKQPAPLVQRLRDTLVQITGQSVVYSGEGPDFRIKVDGFERPVFLAVVDEHTWSLDLNEVHDYVDAAVRVAASEIGGEVRGVPEGIRPWADTARWPSQGRLWGRRAATPLFVAIELVLGVVLLPIVAVRALRRSHSSKP